MIKLNHIAKLFLFLALCMSCEVNDDSMERTYLVDLPENELVFELFASVTPMTHSMTLTDTLWISLHLEDSVLVDKVSQQEIALPLRESQFVLQLEVIDLITQKPAKISIIERNGRLIGWEGNISTANKLTAPSTITVEFGYPDLVPMLDIGFVFNDVGRYALVLHNYPNPFLDEEDEVCTEEECNEKWYDLRFFKDPNSSELLFDAFVDYRFNTSDLLPSDSQLNDYTDISTYNNAIYPVNVR